MKIKTYLYIIFCLLTPIPTFADSKKHQVYQGNSLNELEIWWGGDGISGNWFGWRSKLSEIGLQPFADYTFDIFGNTAGGIKRGTVYSGLLSFGIEVDLEKLVGWKGAVFLNSWKWLSGRDASEDLVGNFFTISNIAGFNTLRVFDLW
ncbi:MAG: hypothetical protein NZL93_01390, partial [Chthoniobacterales bacterium]|nr:hypothetical protein [Chthoniobacterales bacterium]